MPAGLVLAGVIVDRLDFHWLFWLAIAPIVAGAILSATVIRPSPVGAPGRVNIAAAKLLSAGLSAVLLAITETASWGWGDPRTIALSVGGAASLVAWAQVELRSDDPLVDIRLMRRRGVWSTNATTLLHGVGVYVAFVLMPRWVELPSHAGSGWGRQSP